MGCKFGTEQKEELDSEIKTSVKIEDEFKKRREHNLDYYLKQEEEELKGKKLDDKDIQNYSNLIFEEINRIRKNPQRYADDIEDSMENIIEVGEGDKKKYIFKKQIKVLLDKGEPDFREAAKALREIDPLPNFEQKQELCVPLPTSKNQINDKNYLKRAIENKRQNNIKVDGYFKEMVKSPEISMLLMMVNEKKRMLLMSKELKNIGISSGIIENTFVSYFVFSR